ncbi:golgin subfamily A member 7B-like isoform X4 [Heterodontus francisci]|uniref:golgin subfamily A member 7B-like isoform X4 n=1 Tax=Heterodontus francisci TaxID=7792 RepID=UPI00355C02B4
MEFTYHPDCLMMLCYSSYCLITVISMNTPGHEVHNLQELRPNASLATKVFIQRDYTDGILCQFQTKFPPELESRVLKKISKYIQEQNEKIYAPRGLLVTDPIERGLRVIEIAIYEDRCSSGSSSSGSSTSSCSRG